MDLLAVLPTGIAAAAAVTSVVAITLARNSQKSADFFRVHDRLMSQDVQAGRRLLLTLSEEHDEVDWERVAKKQPEIYDRVNFALGVYETLAQYTKFRYVSRRRVRRMWHDAICAGWPAIESFIRWRRSQSPYRIWHELEWLGRRAGADVRLER